MAVLSLQQDNRFPSTGLKTPINAIYLRLYFSEKVSITLDVSAARRPNLYERKLPLVYRVQFKEPFDRKKTFENAFGVVQTVYPHSHKNRFHSMFFQQRGPFRVWVGGLWHLWRKLLKVHTDGKGPDHGEVFVA